MVFAGLAVAVTWAAQYAAVDHLPVGAVYLIMYLSPVLVVLGAGFLGERIHPRLLVGLALGVVGVACVAYSMWTGDAVWPSGGNRLTGVLLAIGAAVGLAGLNLGTKVGVRYYRAELVPLQEFVVASMVLVPLAVLRADRWPTAAEWMWLVALGVVHSGLAVLVFSIGLTMVPVSTASVLAYAEPVGAVVIAWLVLGEVPQLWTVVGGVLIVIGGIFALRDVAREP
jgi:drug/metabolite transporter (DMT)-like permease